MISFVSKSANPMPKEPKECNIYIPSLFKHKFSSTKGPNTIFLFNLAKMAAGLHTFYEHKSIKEYIKESAYLFRQKQISIKSQINELA